MIPKPKPKFKDQGWNDPPKIQLQISNADQVFEEMIQEGMVWFGSFWGIRNSESLKFTSSDTMLKNLQLESEKEKINQ